MRLVGNSQKWSELSELHIWSTQKLKNDISGQVAQIALVLSKKSPNIFLGAHQGAERII